MPLSEEYRLAIDDYWTDKNEVNLTKDEYIWVESIAKRIKSNFVTVDLARKEDGSLIIMEFGDGQVSRVTASERRNFLQNLQRTRFRV